MSAPLRNKTRAAASIIDDAAWRHAKTKPEAVDAPKRRALRIDGVGLPDDPSHAFQDAIAALFGLAYTIKFSRKKRGRADFKVGPLEAVWHAPDRARSTFELTAENARWRLRLPMPSDVTGAELEAARKALAAKRGEDRTLADVVVELIPAARLWRILHVGPYRDEHTSFDALFAAMKHAGARPGGFHHEIYLSDPRRTAPARLKTILLVEQQNH